MPVQDPSLTAASPEGRRALKDFLLRLNAAALAAVAPDGAVLRHLSLDRGVLSLFDEADREPVWSRKLDDFARIRVLGAGKGAAPMALALENLLGDRIDDGLIIVKYGHDLPEGQRCRRIRVLEAAHPVPDEAGQRAAASLVEAARACGPEDLALCVFTGGASALTPALRPGLTLEDLQSLTRRLLQCGAEIHEINALRKHLSQLSGGALARAVSPAAGFGLLVSDVVGDDMDVIASGPTVPDASTFADCLATLEKYGLRGSLPRAVEIHLEEGLAGRQPETPKADDPAFACFPTVLVASLRQAMEAAAEEAEKLGCRPLLLTDRLTGEARVRAAELVQKAREIQRELSPSDRPVCLLAGGETTVTLRGRGLGGRNQEMALAAAIELARDEGIDALFAGTDGTDGPTEAAGGFALSGDLPNWPASVSPRESLDDNASNSCLAAADALLVTGPTRTNVMDLAIFLIRPRS